MSAARWERLADQDGRGWDAALAAAEDRNPFQARAWGEYKRRHGWLPQRWLARDRDGGIKAGLQILQKRLPFSSSAVWAPGGPLLGFAGTKPEEEAGLLQGWLAAFRRDNRLCYARLRCHARSGPSRIEAFAKAFSRPAFRLSSGQTVSIDLTLPPAELRGAMSPKHRYYVKQSEKAGIVWRSGNDAGLRQDMLRLYQEMLQAKSLAGRGFAPAAVEELGETFQDDAVFLVGRRDGAPVTACMALQTGASAFFAIAATGAAGRRLSASYAMVSKLFELLRSRGVSRFDFGGIAPAKAEAAGVDHFKRGFGGQALDYTGEWEWAPQSRLRLACNWVLRAKGGLL